MQKATSIEQLITDMPKRWLPDKAAGIHATIQLDLSGDQLRQTRFIISDGTLEIQPGPADHPNLTLTASAADYLAMSNGDLDAVKAYMQGKLKAKGDLGLALKFQSMFDFDLD